MFFLGVDVGVVSQLEVLCDGCDVLADTAGSFTGVVFACTEMTRITPFYVFFTVEECRTQWPTSYKAAYSLQICLE